MEANIKDYFEIYEVAKTNKEGGVETDEAGKMLVQRKQRAKLLSDLPDEIAKLIEDVTIDRNGNVIPKLYSKAQAHRGLRDMLNIGRQEERPADDISKLSDAELIAQLSDQANQLGVKIDLSYSFAQQPTEAETDGSDGRVIDAVAQPDAQHVEEDRRAVEAARELATSALPAASSQRRQDTPAGARKKAR